MKHGRARSRPLASPCPWPRRAEAEAATSRLRRHPQKALAKKSRPDKPNGQAATSPRARARRQYPEAAASTSRLRRQPPEAAAATRPQQRPHLGLGPAGKGLS